MLFLRINNLRINPSVLRHSFFVPLRLGVVAAPGSLHLETEICQEVLRLNNLRSKFLARPRERRPKKFLCALAP